MKERLNYTIENGRYCGHLVNIPVVAEADTLDGLKTAITVLAKHWIHHLTETLKQDEPFEITQLPNTKGGYAE